MIRQDFSVEQQHWMEVALRMAQRAFVQEEVPIGAVVVYKNRLVAASHNMVEQQLDPSAHAERLALVQAAQRLGDWRLVDCTLFVTLEPCCMCLGALPLFRLRNVVYGAPDKRHGGYTQWAANTLQNHPIHKVDYVGGLFAARSAALLRQFFQQKRKRHD